MTAGSFKQVYLSLHPKLYRVACTILKNTEDAEDIIQDTYCKLWDDRKKLVDIQKPEAYCVTLVKHLCMDFLRLSKTAQNNHHIDDYDFPDYSTNAENRIEDRETIRKIKSIIRSLPEKQQRILNLRGFADCSLEEIEKITGESAVNVRVLLSRARNTLKMKLKH
ncbi:MAG: sigma-70 family RNA polymerase sigma factor [Tannerella sp.]|jgi:RNA polymerase sigma-70 factor (ECF subfamily)|nr:sigma-70 family RNA polymerase sigma factor [Tannerella sp.]